MREFTTTTFGRWSFSQKERVKLIAAPGLWEISVAIPCRQTETVFTARATTPQLRSCSLFEVGLRQVASPSCVLVYSSILWGWPPLLHGISKSVSEIRAVEYSALHQPWTTAGIQYNMVSSLAPPFASI